MFSCFHLQGANFSQLERSIGDSLPVGEHYLGLSNVSLLLTSLRPFLSCYTPPLSLQFGNTCYANSVLQALYFCLPFREKVLAHKHSASEPETLLSSLSDLFQQINSFRKKFGVLHPRRFINKVKKENGVCVALHIAK